LLAPSVSIAIRYMPRRPEFATILKTEGVDGLTSALNRRAEALAMSAARTFWKLPFEFPAAIQTMRYVIAGFSSTPKPTRSGEI